METTATPTQEQTPVTTPEVTPQVAATPVDGQQQATETPANPRQDIDAIATELGIPAAQLSGFNTAEEARKAVGFWLTQSANAGLTGGAPPVQHQPTPPQQQVPLPQPVAPQPVNLTELGLNENDPAAKALRALESRLNEQAKQSEEVLSRFRQQEEAQAAAERAAVSRKFDEAIAKFGDNRYGNPVTGNQTPGQKFQQNHLLGLAVGILQGERIAGRPDPSLDVLFARARVLHDLEYASTPQPTAPVPQAPQALPTSGGNVPLQQKQGLSMTDKWSEDPVLRAQLGIA